jgi:hypothetical protein
VVNKEVEHSSWGGAWHCDKRNLHSCFSERKQLRKSSWAASCLLALFCVWGCAKSQPTDYLT